MVFQSAAGGILNVHRARLDGGGARALTDDPEGVGWPVPSPDGRTLAVEMFRGNDTQLGLPPPKAALRARLTRLPGQHWHDWSQGRPPRSLRRPARRPLERLLMDVETGEERRLTDHGRVRDAVRTPAWSPSGDPRRLRADRDDGRRLADRAARAAGCRTLALARQD